MTPQQSTRNPHFNTHSYLTSSPIGQPQNKDHEHGTVGTNTIEQTKHVQQLRKIDKMFQGIVKERIFGTIIAEKSRLSNDQYLILDKFNKTVTTSRSHSKNYRNRNPNNFTAFLNQRTKAFSSNTKTDNLYYNIQQRQKQKQKPCLGFITPRKRDHSLNRHNQQYPFLSPLKIQNKSFQRKQNKIPMMNQTISQFDSNKGEIHSTIADRQADISPVQRLRSRKRAEQQDVNFADKTMTAGFQLYPVNKNGASSNNLIKDLQEEEQLGLENSSKLSVKKGDKSPKYPSNSRKLSINDKNYFPQPMSTYSNFQKSQPPSLSNRLQQQQSKQFELSRNITIGNPLESPRKILSKRLQQKQNPYSPLFRQKSIRLKQMNLQNNTPDGDRFIEHFKQLSTTPNIFLYDIKISKQTLIQKAKTTHSIDGRLIEYFMYFYNIPQICTYRQLRKGLQKAFNSPQWLMYFFVFRILDESGNGFLTISDLFRFMQKYPNCNYIEPQIFNIKNKISEISQELIDKTPQQREVTLSLEQILITNHKLKMDQVEELLKKSAKQDLHRIGENLKITCYSQSFMSLEHDVNMRLKQEELEMKKNQSENINGGGGNNKSRANTSQGGRMVSMSRNNTQRSRKTRNGKGEGRGGGKEGDESDSDGSEGKRNRNLQENKKFQGDDGDEKAQMHDKALQDGVRFGKFGEIFKGRRPKLMCLLANFLTGLKSEDYE